MAAYTDELVTLLSLKGNSAFTRGMQQAGGAIGNFVQRNRGFIEGLAELGPIFGKVGGFFSGVGTKALDEYKGAQHIRDEMKALFTQRGMGDEAVKNVEEIAEKMLAKGGVALSKTRKSSSILASFGFDDSEMVKFLPYIAAQARLYGQDMESVSMAIGKAFGSGNYGLLTRYGITMSQADKAMIAHLSDIQATGDAATVAAAKQQAMNIVLQSLKDYTVPLGEGMNNLADQELRVGAISSEVYDRMGEGVAQAKMFGLAIRGDIAQRLLEVDPAFLRAAGAASYYGGSLLRGVGTAAEYANHLLGVASSATILKGANIAGIPSTMAATTAQAAHNQVAVAGAVANRGLAASLWATAGPLLAIAGALAAAALWWRNYRIASETQKEREYAAETDRVTAELARSRGLKYDKSGALVKDPNATPEGRAAAAEWLRQNQGKQQPTTWRTGGEQSATATRQPGGVIRVEIQGGAGVNENDLRNFNTMVQ